jgi:hypothetical protein
LLTGRYPFISADPVEMERLHLEAPPPRPSASAPVSAEIDAVVLRCLEKRPARRFFDAQSFLEALRAAVNGSQTAGAEGQGVAINVEIRIGGEEDEALLTSLVQLLDDTELQLRQAGYSLYLQTGSAILGVKPLPADEAEAEEARKEALELARKLVAPLGASDADPRLKLVVQVHAGAAQVRDGEVTGGPLVDIESWLQPGDAALRATPAASKGLQEE